MPAAGPCFHLRPVAAHGWTPGRSEVSACARNSDKQGTRPAINEEDLFDHRRPATAVDLVMPDTVTLGMADLAKTVNEGLLALAAEAGSASRT